MNKTGADSVSISRKDARSKTGVRQPLLLIKDGYRKISLPAFDKLKKKYKKLDRGGKIMFISRYISTILHTSAFIAICFFWIQISNGVYSQRLLSNSYTLTDIATMNGILNSRGFVTPMMNDPSIANSLSGVYMGPITAGGVYSARFPMLDKSSLLHLAQPVMIQSGGLYSLAPTTSCVDQMLLSHNNNTDIWRACVAQGIPVRLIDLSYAENTLMPFASNNILAIMYHTMMITMVLAMAALPRCMGVAWGVLVGMAILCTSLFFTVIAPFVMPSAQIPLNNAVIGVVLHIVTIVMLVVLVKPKDRQGSVKPSSQPSTNPDASEQPPPTNPEDGLPSAPPPPEEASFNLHFLGRHLVSSGQYSNLWGNMYNGKLDQVLRFVPTGTKWENGGDVDDGDSGIDGNVVGPAHDQVLIVARDGTMLAGVPQSFINHTWVDEMERGLDMVNVRYFEFTMTAGLFLVCSVLSVDRTANVHILHMTYLSMMLCNVVAIPITKGLNIAYRNENHRVGGIEAAMLLLIASFLFFAAGMTSVLMATWGPMSQAPDFVRMFYVGTIGVYFSFAIGGGVYILLMAVQIGASKTSMESTAWYQLWMYESLNLGKAVLAFLFVSSVAVTAI